jgi:Protein of unknown function (DUF1622)
LWAVIIVTRFQPRRHGRNSQANRDWRGPDGRGRSSSRDWLRRPRGDVKLAARPFRDKAVRAPRKEIWLSFGLWLLLGLEFELAADIVRSVISPSWADIGQLGAIAVIRTFLNYFLERDPREVPG